MILEIYLVFLANEEISLGVCVNVCVCVCVCDFIIFEIMYKVVMVVGGQVEQ